VPISHTNRKGRTFFLCQGVSKTGKVRHFFSISTTQNMLDEIPADYHIEESVNGVVSLVRNRAQAILLEEVQLVEAALQRHPKGNNYRVSAKGKQITVHERIGPDEDAIADIFDGMIPMLSRKDILDRSREFLDTQARYSPMLHFNLVNIESRTFCAERATYVASLPEWVRIYDCGLLQELVDEIIPWLDTDEYFEL